MPLDSPFDSRNSPRKPVILGAGMTGLAISRSLAEVGVEHVLIGSRPSALPRLGESLNAEASVEFQRQFPDLDEFLSPKSRQAILIGDHSLTFDFPRFFAGMSWDLILGYPSNIPLYHVDRIGFDSALFTKATGNHLCQFVEGRAASIEYKHYSDRITGVTLESGGFVPTSFVFDATNDVRFLARKVGIACRVIGDERRVVFTHYVNDGIKASADLLPWAETTLLVRLDQADDLMDGLVWVIPFANRLSVGVSVDAAKVQARPSLLLKRVEAALLRRGIPVRAAFPHRLNPIDIRHQHYDHDRCYGANWIMAGASCCSTWFPSAAGIATGLVAARLAPRLLISTKETCRSYQSYIDQVAAAHSRLDWLTRDDPSTLTEQSLSQKSREMVGGNLKRLALSFRVDSTDRIPAIEAISQLYFAERRDASPSAVLAARPTSFGTQLLANRPVRATQPEIEHPPHLSLDAHPAIQAVVDALSGRVSPDRLVERLTADFHLVIPPFNLRGVQSLVSLIKLIRSNREKDALEFIPSSLVEGPIVMTVQGSWKLGRNESANVYIPVEFRFVISEEKIVILSLDSLALVPVLGEVARFPVSLATLFESTKTAAVPA